MGTPQTTVQKHPDYGMPGQLATLRAAADAKVDTYLQEEASAHIPFGYVVKLGTPDLSLGINGAKLPSAKTDKLVGIACFAHSYARTNAQEIDSTGLSPGTHFGVVRQGAVFVMPEEDVAAGDDAHARVTANSGKLPGMIGKTDDGVRTIDISALVQWETAGGPTSGQPARLWVDFNNAALAVTDS